MSSAPFLLATAVVLADKQGYTPYGYGMDTPVLVRASTSYGRGWQLLRSRGEKSNATGPCDPPQKANSCTHCQAQSGTDDVMPACKPSAACEAHEVATGMRVMPASSLLFMQMHHLRFFCSASVQKAYASQLGLLLRAVRSLRVVNTSLPIHVLVSGHRS